MGKKQTAPATTEVTSIEVIEGAIDALDSNPALDELMAALESVPADEVQVETHDDHDAEAIDAAVSGAEAIEASIKAATVDEHDDGSAPTEPTGEDAAIAADATEAPKGKKKGTGAKRVHYSDKTQRIIDRLGDKASEFTVLTLADAELDEDAIKLVMAETFDTIRKMNKKQQARAGLLMDFVSGKSTRLNEVATRTLKLLHSSGAVSMGKDGNLLKDLLAKPYSPGAARAMGGNTVGMFEDLKLVVKDGVNYRVNPESLLLAKTNSLLGLKAAAV
jgi:hypothetical protein